MRGLWKRIEAMFAAAAFAEEGEVETARRLAADGAREVEEPAAPRLRPVRRSDERPRQAPARKIARLP